ncbi:hypothetical protein NB700_001806 [Xanthomonas sacchari]|uniref:Uncharacterized protein n=1 Tax=Xanthomonas sacchari TaxID=56458 RepID=A0ABT3DW98_9XANT|nr:hypothetical protein [Xanthomonas sacchari]MCW0399250.1 hypothetical protein [Xanthomonas sacchari]
MSAFVPSLRMALVGGALCASAIGLVLAYQQMAGTGLRTPQSLIGQSEVDGSRTVNRLSHLDSADAAEQVVNFNPLTNPGHSEPGAAALAELGQYTSNDPVFTLRIRAPDIDVAMNSLQQIYAQLNTNDAQALDFAVRFLAVTKLKGSDFAAYGQDPSAIPDNALFRHILPLIDGQTPMQVMVAARAEQVRLGEYRKQVPADPFDRMEMERQGQDPVPGMTIPN